MSFLWNISLRKKIKTYIFYFAIDVLRFIFLQGAPNNKLEVYKSISISYFSLYMKSYDCNHETNIIALERSQDLKSLSLLSIQKELVSREFLNKQKEIHHNIFFERFNQCNSEIINRSIYDIHK